MDQIRHRVVIEHDLEMKTRDGVTLRADVFRPDIPGPVPAILCRTPYDKSLRSYINAYLPAVVAAEAGFAYVCQDLRGRFASEGEWIPFSAEVEQPDGYDTVEWVASQPWCDGKVGMIGCSYESFNVLAAAVTHPPSLRAIVPQGSAFRRRGPMGLSAFTIAWTAQMVAGWIAQRAENGLPIDPLHSAAVMAAMQDPVTAALHLPLLDHPLAQVPLPGEPFQWSLRDDLALGYVPWEDVEVPALFVAGWFDACVATGVQQFRAIRDHSSNRAAREATQLIVGPWTHCQSLAYAGELYFGAFGSGLGGLIAQQHLDFYARHLRGEDPYQVSSIVRYFVTGTNSWKEASEWPPPATTARRLHLHSGGRANASAGNGVLSWEPAVLAELPDSYSYDPLDPVPSHGNRQMPIGGTPVGPIEQARVENRADVLVYSSEPLRDPLELAGGVDLRLFVASSAPDTDFVAKLCDVSPDGISVNLCDGIERARWRNGATEPSFLTPAEVYEFMIDLGPIAHVFRPGHRVRLQVTSSMFPGWDRNMNTRNPVGVDIHGEVARNTVFHDADRPSCLTVWAAP